jgi:WhiB family redox-sensing transcriptional regulator
VIHDAWKQHAVCRGADPHLFFPENPSSRDVIDRYCRACPVVTDCLAYALRSGASTAGIWGATTERDRDRMRNRRTRKAVA